MDAEQRVTENIDLWTSAIRAKATQGRGSSKKHELHGIKKLRELILNLAIRGKLVSQDPNAEPASVLLKQITAARTQWAKENKITPPKKLAEISNDEKLFNLPNGWAWTRFGEIFDMQYGDNLPEPKRSNTGEYPVYGSNGVVGSHERYSVSQPCIVIGRKGSAGALNLCLNDGCWVTDVAYSLVPPSGLDLYFTYNLLHTLSLDNLGKGIKPGLNRNESNTLLLAIPPIEEQHRIVKKINELMTLCDQLEQYTESSLEAHQVLVDTLLESLTTANNARELSENWARLSEHFDTLITTDYAVEQLKNTVLKLAVMGKLVPQNPSDEPVSELLKRIAAEKAQLIKDKKIKNQPPLPEIAEEEKPFDLPEGWKLCRLDDICYGITSGSTPPKNEFHESEGVPYLKVYNIRDQLIDFKYKPQYLQPKYHSTKLKRSILYPGDIVMNIVGPPLGKVAIIPDTYPEWNCNQAITFFRPINPKLNTYIYTYLKAGSFLNFIELIGTAGQDNISVTKSRSIVLPTPPLNEQYRIVAKVDELMSLCDRLKNRLSRVQTTQMHFADAVAYEVIGESIKNIEDAEVNTQVMKITTILSLNHEVFGDDAVIAPILLESGGSADAKDVWSKTKLSLPEFYAQLKIEIDAEYVSKPKRADF